MGPMVHRRVGVAIVLLTCCVGCRKANQTDAACVARMIQMWSAAESYCLTHEIGATTLLGSVELAPYFSGDLSSGCPQNGLAYPAFVLSYGPRCSNGHSIPPRIADEFVAHLKTKVAQDLSRPELVLTSLRRLQSGEGEITILNRKTDKIVTLAPGRELAGLRLVEIDQEGRRAAVLVDGMSTWVYFPKIYAPQGQAAKIENRVDAAD